MLPVGRYEVYNRCATMLQIKREIYPAVIWFQLGIASACEEVGTSFVESWHTSLTTTSDIDRGKVERQAKQVVAQCIGDEFVDGVTSLTRHATNNRAGCLF